MKSYDVPHNMDNWDSGGKKIFIVLLLLNN